MTDGIEVNLGRKPEQMSADNGYCSEVNLIGLEARGIDGYVATGRAKDAPIEDAVTGMSVAVDDGGTSDSISRPEAASARAEAEPALAQTRVEVMREKIKAGGDESPYRFRKQLPEPVSKENDANQVLFFGNG